jgi:hypothetical protein
LLQQIIGIRGRPVLAILSLDADRLTVALDDDPALAERTN